MIKPRLEFRVLAHGFAPAVALKFALPLIHPYWVSSSIAAARYAAPMDDASLICTIFTIEDTCTGSSPESRPLPADGLTSSSYLATLTQPSGRLR